jgi:hypothetical protein
MVALFLALALPGVQQPVSDDEIYEVRNAERLLAHEPIHLYVPPVFLILAATIVVCGLSEFSMRLPGLLSWILGMALTARLARRMGLDPPQTRRTVVAGHVACGDAGSFARAHRQYAAGSGGAVIRRSVSGLA